MKIALIIARTLASGLGSGFLPKAPGTWGTLAYAAILVYLTLNGLPLAHNGGGLWYPLMVIVVTSTAALSATALCLFHGECDMSPSVTRGSLHLSRDLPPLDSVPETAGQDLYTSKTAKESDPQWIVVDEWAGLSITTIVAPYSVGSGTDLALTLAAIVLFRIFDVTKPFGVKAAEKLPGAFGVVIDDVIAGSYATLTLWLGKSILMPS